MNHATWWTRVLATTENRAYSCFLLSRQGFPRASAAVDRAMIVMNAVNATRKQHSVTTTLILVETQPHGVFIAQSSS